MIERQLRLPADAPPCLCPRCKRRALLWQCHGAGAGECATDAPRYRLECPPCHIATARHASVRDAVCAWYRTIIHAALRAPAPGAATTRSAA